MSFDPVEFAGEALSLTADVPAETRGASTYQTQTKREKDF
jgi:hypothetical protein